MRVLAITAHPDDMELECAGTLLKCVQRGDEVFSCHVSDGSLGHMIIGPEELGKIRREEAKKAGELAGITVIWGGCHDLDIYADNKATRDRIVEIIRTVRPDFIITHYPDDYMADHNAVSKLVFDASFAASVPHYECAVMDSVADVTPIFYMRSSKGLGFIPTEYVDITDVAETKKQMFLCHDSQVRWLQDHDHIDPTDSMVTIDHLYGLQSGVEYAEGFIPCCVDHRMRTRRFLP